MEVPLPWCHQPGALNSMRLTRQPHPIGSGGSPVDPAEKRTYFLMATGDTVSRRSLGVMEEGKGRLGGFSLSLSLESESVQFCLYCCICVSA